MPVRSSSTKSNPFGAWMAFGAAYMRMSVSAGEVIARRTRRMALGAMTAPEAVAMTLEKGTADAAAATGAAVAAALRTAITPIDDVRSTARYRLEIAGNLLARFVDNAGRS